MTSKVIEANAGIHSLGMAVAPVTSWRLYDSIYTERYMGLPDVNPGGYVNASISNVTGFHNVNYLLAHGSGDDNGMSSGVHHQEKTNYRFLTCFLCVSQFTMQILHICWICLPGITSETTVSGCSQTGESCAVSSKISRIPIAKNNTPSTF
jgi:hypothetical protein